MIKLNFNKKFAACKWERVNNFKIYGGILIDAFAIETGEAIVTSIRLPINTGEGTEVKFIEITQKVITGSTPQHRHEQVEKWTQEQFENIVTLLYNHYNES